MGENKKNSVDSVEAKTDEREGKDGKPKSPAKKAFFTLLKVAFAVGAYYVIFGKIIQRDGAEGLTEHVANLHWGWIAAAVAMQVCALFFAALRWRALLIGQGIRPTTRFLAGSIMIARFFGAFTPSGVIGFSGWRIFDVSQHTGKVARATATIAVESLLGQVAFGLVVMGASVYGVRFIGSDGVLLVNVAFLGIVSLALLLIAKPVLFRWGAGIFLPARIRPKVQTLVTAICAYKGQGKTLAYAVLCGVAVHTFNNLIYVCAARALNVELGVGEVFFASSLQILATLIPASINGMGLRETAAVALYTSPAIGLPLALAVLIPIVGFCCEMFVSAFGGLVFLARRSGYKPHFEIEDDAREDEAYAAEEDVPLSKQPKPLRGLSIGLGAGLLAGVIVGAGEGLVIILSGNGAANLGVMAYGAVAYGIFCALAGAGMGWALALSGRDDFSVTFMTLPFRWKGRRAAPEPEAYAKITAFLVGLFGFALGLFRVRRDYYHEELVWKSGKGVAVFFGCLLIAVGVGFILQGVLRWIVARKPGKIMLRVWGSAVVAASICGLLALAAMLSSGATAEVYERPEAPPTAGNVLFIVVDTLRADHLTSYGYENGSTPALDAFAQDAVRFDMAFANASWTRPSFASIMTGRLPSNHGVMSKVDALPDEIVTMAEAMRDGGYHTGGLVTNFNVAPYYNFHQGFDSYRFLEPEFVLGADDSAAKLLLIQFLRQRIEKYKAARDQVDPGSVYRDAEVVNRELLGWLDEREGDERPFYSFVGYMDPHDPYYEHPYDGRGYARAAHQEPDPAEADRLRGLYDGEITFWDRHFGELVEELKRRGLYDDLTIVITSDHGEEFCEHGGFWHGTTLYDEQIRVPLLVKLPENRRGGTTVRHWVQSIDLMPSVLRQVGLEVPEGGQGGDIFEGTDTVYAEESHEGNVLESIRERRGTDERKIIWANAGNPRGLETVELYDIADDVSETRNVAESREDEIEHLQAVLEAMQTIAREGAATADSVEMDDATLERLCGLGYMERTSCCERGLAQFCDDE
ncbi:MAG: arylsulfatase A-like enzyme/uncharacterized membrane protein YbhN (UPF0104 family) [Polyangiales bacterium]|jgi:arylsulfatase A-like enzyme/uncharacterized membrane protein YbhN (UPF0104 family)